VVLDVRPAFGAEPRRRPRREDARAWTLRTDRLHLRWTGGAEAEVDEDGRLLLELTVPDGGRHDLLLEIGERALARQPVHPNRAWERTEREWAGQVPQFLDAAAPRDSRHAYAVLRGLTTSGGGMVAAATMSLPERADRGRNYDYRYAWIRDQCYAGIAVAAAGPHPLLHDAVRFITDRVLADGAQLKPAYLVDGGRVPDQRSLGLAGYPGGTDVLGNHVTEQFQLDALGEVLTLFAAAGRHDALDKDGWRAVRTTVDAIDKRWDEVDAGIWELGEEWWTHSRLACIAGLNAVAALAPRSEASRFRELAAAILAETDRRCRHPEGCWQRSPTDQRVDAALLLPPFRGALPADDPRTRATLAAVRRELVTDGYVYRYSPVGRPLGEAEGAFLLCGFVLALADLQQGNRIEAYRWFERNRAACGPPGLLSEEFDVKQRQLRGNLPQAFVHALLLETSVRLGGDPVTDL
jgi:GH15 family glucan-1,4-alpha-glucosidase